MVQYVSSTYAVLSSTLTVVVKQLLDQVNVGEHHSSAAVSLEAEIVQGISLVVVSLEQTQVRLPLVADHLPAREASHRDDHGCCVRYKTRGAGFPGGRELQKHDTGIT